MGVLNRTELGGVEEWVTAPSMSISRRNDELQVKLVLHESSHIKTTFWGQHSISGSRSFLDP